MGEEADIRQEFGRLLADMDFLEADLRFRAPNVFSIFQMEYVEAKHSAFLSWLLDPNSEHGLQDEFLRRFLAAALANPPVDRDKPAEGLSPIPYDAVYEKLLRWDLMDVLSADLRETNVTTDFRRRSDGGRIHICMWNDSYHIAAYVENAIAPRLSWRVRQGPGAMIREFESERYLLDLFAQWGTDDAGGYEILPVFLSLGDVTPRETRCFHHATYAWMPAFLEPLTSGSAIPPQAQYLIRDFCDWLKWESPAELDPELHGRMDRLARQYGRTICRLTEHVSQCSGCEDDDVAAAYHDVYRRHGSTMDRLAAFAESVPDEGIAKMRGEVETAVESKDLVYEQGPSSLSAFSKGWERSAGRNALKGVEVYASARSASCGAVLYTDPLSGTLETMLRAAEELADEREMEISRPVRAMRNFNLLHYLYDTFDPISAAADFVRCCHFMDALFERLK